MLCWINFGVIPLYCLLAVDEQWWACPDLVCPHKCRHFLGRQRAEIGGPLGSRNYHRPHDKTTWGAKEGTAWNIHSSTFVFDCCTPVLLWLSAVGKDHRFEYCYFPMWLKKFFFIFIFSFFFSSAINPSLREPKYGPILIPLNVA